MAFVHMCGEWLHVGTRRSSAETARMKMWPSCPAQCLNLGTVPTYNSCASLGRVLQI
jgi:hypothetical protein